MEIEQTPLNDCFIIKTNLFGDERGFFMESFNSREFQRLGLEFAVEQINFAKSQKNVLRGLHYQKAPMQQAKLVGVMQGAVLDVVVDLRSESSTFLRYFKLKIDSPETLLYIPKGFAHGYYTMEDNTFFYYAVNQLYSPESEAGLHYADKTLDIDWGNIENAVISPKDLNQPELDIKNIQL